VAQPRPYWKGYLKLSLVSCPISLHSAASSSERITFRQINKATGHRIKQQLVDEVTREPVEAEDKGRGYEYAKGEYLIVDDDEINAIAIESSQTIDIDRFVPRAQIDERYFDGAYYVSPNDRVGQDAFAVIREAMRGKDVVALGRIVLAKRERVIMLQPWDKGLLGTTLRYAYEVRDASGVFEDIADVKIEAELLKLAEHILDTKRGDFQPETFVDRYEEAVLELLRAKQAGLPAPAERRAPEPARVINLMDALRRSLEAERSSAMSGGKRPPGAKPAGKGKKRIEGQKEMLLPIAGKKAAPKEPTVAARPSSRRKAS
jgi:DNA end-binding protein Ku